MHRIIVVACVILACSANAGAIPSDDCRNGSCATAVADPFRLVNGIEALALPHHGRRTLVVRNFTGMTIHVYVSYRTRYTDGSWGWSNSGFDSYWTLRSGRTTSLIHGKNGAGGDFVVNADYIRIYAVSADGRFEWNQDRRERVYIGGGSASAGVIGNFTYTFR